MEEPFLNATCAERVWKYQDLLKAELDKRIRAGLIQGKDSRSLARDVQRQFNVSQSDAERLMTTELSRVQTEAQKQAYLRNGCEEYEFLAFGAACPVCAALSERCFQVKYMTPGENEPPMHPRCHCTTAPYWDEDEFQKWLEEENRKMHGRMEAEESGGDGRISIGAIALEALSGSNASGKQQAQDLPNTVASGLKSDIIMTDKQFGKKIGKHAQDYGLNPGLESDRGRMKKIISETVNYPDEIRSGEWRGQPGTSDFYIKGSDVVVMNNGIFVTILKGGISNARVKNARKREV